MPAFSVNGALSVTGATKKAVTTAGKSLDKARAVGRVTQSVAQPGYRAVKPLVEFDKGVRRPHPGTQLVPSHNLTGLFQKNLEDLAGLILEFDLHAVLAQLGGVRVEFKDAELDQSAGRDRRKHGTARKCSTACNPAPDKAVSHCEHGA